MPAQLQSWAILLLLQSAVLQGVDELFQLASKACGSRVLALNAKSPCTVYYSWHDSRAALNEFKCKQNACMHGSSYQQWRLFGFVTVHWEETECKGQTQLVSAENRQACLLRQRKAHIRQQKLEMMCFAALLS